MSALMSFLIGITATFAFAEATPRWSEGEHFELGDKGALLACRELGIDSNSCPNKNIPRHDKKILFNYGELLASADSYLAPMDLYWDYHTGVKQIIRCAHRLYKDQGEGSCTLPGVLYVPGYLEVVSQNYDHFGWNNMKAYIHFHQMALLKAQEAFHKPPQSREAQDLKTQALIINAFADHYLTDSFSAGHIRLPRIQIKNWARKNLTGAFKSYRGDILAIVLHDSESRNLKSGQEQGFYVQNSRGDHWLTHGDQELHFNPDPADPAFIYPLMAVKESFKELLLVLKTGTLPTDIFKATTYVPFPDEVSLIEKLSPQFQQMKRKDLVRAVYNTLPFYQKILFPKLDFERLLECLPEIFKDYRKDILTDINNNKELSQRLPSPYLEAYLKIH